MLVAGTQVQGQCFRIAGAFGPNRGYVSLINQEDNLAYYEERGFVVCKLLSQALQGR